MKALAVIALASASLFAAGPKHDEQGVRDLIARWNAAYRGMDAKTLASLNTPDFEMIDRFGHWLVPKDRSEMERLWEWTFKEVYKGKPGPERQIESIRFLAPEVALVEARAHHPEPIVLDDGQVIPPFWEINTYVCVDRGGEWLVAAHSIHNQITPEMEGAGSKIDPKVRPTGR